MHKESFNLTDVIVDGTLQQRKHGLDDETISVYMDAAAPSWPFPPIVVYRDSEGQLFLADGFHRVEVAKRLRMEQIEAEIRSGGRHDALLYAVGANHDNGLPRTNEDKRKAVKTVLADPQCSDLGNRAIAELCNVSHPLVAAVRKEIESTGNISSQPAIPLPQAQSKSDNPLSVEALTDPHQVPTKKVRKTKNGRLVNTTGISESNVNRSRKTPTAEESTQQVLQRYASTCADIRVVDLQPTEFFKVAELARDTLIWFLPRLAGKDADAMKAKIAQASSAETRDE